MQKRTHINQAAAVLWASALVIAALVIMQAGKLTGHSAYAGTASATDTYALVTSNSGQGGETDPNELLFVINRREAVMMVYEIEDARKRQILLRDGGSLVQLFAAAP